MVRHRWKRRHSSYSIFRASRRAILGYGREDADAVSRRSVALAALAGNTVVAAAATDAWETARDWIGRLFGRGGAKQAERAQESGWPRLVVSLWM